MEVSNRKSWFHAEGKCSIIDLPLDIEGMSCASCSSSIERVLRKKEGIISADVNLVMNQATISYDHQKIKISEMIQAIEKAGFHAHIHKEEKTQTIKKTMKVYVSISP